MLKSLMRRQLLGWAIVATLATTACAPNVTNTSSPDAASNSAQSPVATEVASSETKAKVGIGKPAPNFTAIDSNGKSHQLSDFKGKVVVLEWTNHECPFVRKHYESDNMQTTQRKAKDNDVIWLSIVSSAPGQQGHVDGTKANKLTTDRNALPTAVLLDPEGTIGRLYNARTTPHMFVIAADGTLAYMGAIDSIPSSDKADVPKAENYVKAALEKVLKGEAITNATTQPYGCTVKYAS